MNARTRRIIVFVLTIYICFVFIQSLFFKFADSPETQHIFGTLNTWAGSLGFPGLFAHKGIFSQYVVGSVELVASIVLLAGFFTRKVLIHSAGALMSMGVISGAIFFHLFTPLGVQVVNTDGTLDGGELFALACGVWLASFMILALSRLELVSVLHAMRQSDADGQLGPGH
jgi:uncharacterized membrane protein YphA (DoxX/SURF4 family)